MPSKKCLQVGKGILNYCKNNIFVEKSYCSLTAISMTAAIALDNTSKLILNTSISCLPWPFFFT
jgi:hypothetical protein